MSVETKILLTINFEGGALRRSDKAEVREFSLTNKDLCPNRDWKKDEGSKVVKRGKYTYYPTYTAPSSLTVKMCREAYQYMTSSETPEWFIPYKPSKERAKLWNRMKRNEKLEMHLQRICEDRGGKDYTYSIIED